jgi:hypothetical protein
MKIFAFVCLHYGKHYLCDAMRSMRDYVDAFYVAYSFKPSHGHATDLICPEDRDDLFAEAIRGAGTKPLFWTQDHGFRHEGEHRQLADTFAKNHSYDGFITLDSDEVWHPKYAQRFVDILKTGGKFLLRAGGMMHCWKNFDWWCRDRMVQSRGVNYKGVGEVYVYPEKDTEAIYHFGYAQPEDIVRYKMSIHGHKGEIRKDWLEKTYINWKPGMIDVHPTCADNTWEPRNLGRDFLPDFMQGHRFYGPNGVI